MKKLLLVFIILFSNFLYAAVELKPLSEIKFKKGDEAHLGYYAQRCAILINIVDVNYIEISEKMYGKEMIEQMREIGNEYYKIALGIRMKSNNLSLEDAIEHMKPELETIQLGYVEAINKNFIESGQQFMNSFIFDDYSLCFNSDDLNIY